MTKLRSDTLIRLLRDNPRARTSMLCERLGGLDKSTVTRGLKALGEQVVSRGGSRRTVHALRRSLRGSLEPIPVYRIDESGRGSQIGLLDCIHPQGTALALEGTFGWPLLDDMRDGWFEGLPYPFVDMRPQGFLGRNFARQHALTLQVSENPDDWSEDDILHVLSTLGFDLPGDLIVGEPAYRQFLERHRQGCVQLIDDDQLAPIYPERAADALAHGLVGSSAAGEFPKFTASRVLAGEHTEVIVKFSGADSSPAVVRWADLLVCEHLALQHVEETLGIPAALSQIHHAAGRTFLEVLRFDRHGAFGRSGVCTLQSLNAALLGLAPAHWDKVAGRLLGAGLISQADAQAIELLWWFGRLIGNTDMHEGNLAFRPGLRLAPVYDMLPMMYAPARGGEVAAREFAPALPLPSEWPVWLRAAEVAVSYWMRCAGDARISPGFRQICEDNAKILRALQADLA